MLFEALLAFFVIYEITWLYCEVCIVDDIRDELLPIVSENERCERDQHDICAICLSELSECKEVRQIKACGHVFCSTCIFEWLSKRPTCPLCLAVVPKIDT